jgi:hypothetical protein
MVYGIQDLRGIDTQAEIDWFSDAFRPELTMLAQHSGREPSFHWGVVGWLS